MQKRGLKDVKRRNRQVVLNKVMEHGGLSRIEIAHETELAASTVSTLVADLLEEGLLVEAGTVTTAGRSRTELTINPGAGSIPVIEVNRRDVCVTCFNMALEPLHSAVLSKQFLSGNELLNLICDCILSWQEAIPPIVGIGLLFQEDMRSSDFNVMYSTGFSSANISLREALMTRFRVPVEEQYSTVYTVTDALKPESDPAARNSAHLCVGARVVASVFQEGKTVPIRTSFCEAFAGPLDNRGTAPQPALSQYLSQLVALLCMLFRLDTVYLSGLSPSQDGVAAELLEQLSHQLPKSQLPHIHLLRPRTRDEEAAAMAGLIRRSILMAK